MRLEELGFRYNLDKVREEQGIESFEIGRVISEHKERYIVKTENAELDAEVTGNLRFTATSREDFPVVGDWVAISSFDNLAIIHKILPRFSVIKRLAVGQFGDTQIIASNIDCAILVQAIDRDFNINRLERYLTICYASKVTPKIVLTKVDLMDEKQVAEIVKSVKLRIKNVPIIAISNETHYGFDELNTLFEKGKTYCLLGSSGVGKSTMLNKLSGKTLMKTNTISQSTSKGRHVTSHRELAILENGSILIDNPGMREVGIADTAKGLETTFDDIVTLSNSCKFKNCTHTNEAGCSVLEALKNGELNEATYQNFIKLEKEKQHFEATQVEKRKKNKTLGKIVRDYKKIDPKQKKH